MSDRPMRLKYVTKMKIILCIFLLYITAVSVFGQSVELNGIVGESIEFPAAVKIDGSLRYRGVPIGIVASGRFQRGRNGFSGRVHWDSSTGLLSLSGLKMEDSGEYTVQDTDQNINTVFQLNVYIPVLKPHLSVTRNEYRCTVLCAAARGTEATLTLYKNGETNPYVISPVRSHPDLDMTETVESGTYTCEAKNSVSRQTSDPLTVEAHCTAPSGSSIGTIVASVIAVVAIFIAVVFAVLFCRTRSELEVQEISEDKVPPAHDEDEQALCSNEEDMEALHSNAVRILIQVKKLLDNVDPPTYGETMLALPPDGETMPELPPDAVRTLIQVKKLLDNVDPPTYVKKLFDNVDPHAYVEVLFEEMNVLPPYVEDQPPLPLYVEDQPPLPLYGTSSNRNSELE